jgi:CHAT domain-containing protein/Tfp pilus assembly protein PilF
MWRRFIAAAMIGLAACAGPEPDEIRAQAAQALVAGRLSEAERLIERGAASTSGRPDSPQAWRFRLLAAEAQMARLLLAEAERTLAAPVPEGPPFAAVRARQQFLSAKLLVMRGDPKGAAPLLDRARAEAGDDRDLRFDIDVLTSQLRFMGGSWGEAEAGLRALIHEAEAAGDRVHQAQALNNFGMGLVVRGRVDEALPWFERVVALPELDGTTIYGQALNNAGMCLARLGQFERALALQQKAIEVHKGGRQLDYAQALGELGSTYFLQDDVARGMSAWKEALRIATEASLANEAVLWARNLAGASAQAGDWDAAERYNEEATRLAPSQSGSRRAYALVTAGMIASGRGRRDEARRIFDEALSASEDVPAVRWMSHDGLARLAAAEQKPAEAARHFEAALRTVEQTRSALLKADYRISFTSRLIQFYRGYVDFLLSQGQVERALEVADSSRGRVLAERQGVATPASRATAASLKQLARQSRATLAFYWLGPTRSWVWTVGPRGIVATPLPPGPAIETLVGEHQAAIQNALADPLAASGAAGDRLFEMLVGPMASAVPPGGRLVIVPDGALHRLNFETLPVAGPARHYWIEDVTLQIAPSLAMLSVRSDGASALAAASADRRGLGGGRSAPSHMGGTEVPPRRTLLLVGNAAARPPEFPALGYAPAEMRQIARHVPAGSVSVLDGERASPAAFMDADPGRFSMIHFTAHAVANIENPLDSSVILSGPDQAYKLYARNVAALPLTAELVTVSACRSAGERAYAGEGLVGFAWAFLRAGSRRVVAGLWDVDDRSTASLMDEMYRRLAAGARPAEALRDAKLALIRAGYPQPYYWAPFQMFTVVP